MATFRLCIRLTNGVTASRRHSMQYVFGNSTRSPLSSFNSFLNQNNKGTKQSTEPERQRGSSENEVDGQEGSAETATKRQLNTETEGSDLRLLIQELEVKNKDLTENLKLLEDKYKRSLAETENVRERMRRQIDDAKTFGIQAFCKDLLEVADVLKKATESVPAVQLKDSNNKHLKALYDGLQMTETNLQKVFRLHGLNQINPIGEKFDPNFHEALFEDKFDGKTPGTIAVVSKVGYTLHGRTIRSAAVGVVKAA